MSSTTNPGIALPAWTGRAYFALQAVAGCAWWFAVYGSPMVRGATLGSLDAVVVAILDIPLFVVASAVAAFGVRPAAVVSACWTAFVSVALALYATTTGEAGWGALIMTAAAACSCIAVCLIARGSIPTAWIVRGPFAFRPAVVRRGATAHLFATFGQIVVFWGFFLVVMPIVIVLVEQRWGVALPMPPMARVVGAAVLVCASALGIASAIAMATRGRGTPLPSAMPNRLVIAGPYRWVRNPMAVAGIGQGIAVGLILESWLVIAYAIAGSLLWNYAIRPLEEADLEDRFGAEFQAYRSIVRCWVPQPARFSAGGSRLPTRRVPRVRD